MKNFLHVGCGKKRKSDLIGFNNDDWKEIRFDIDRLFRENNIRIPFPQRTLHYTPSNTNKDK